VNSCRNSFKHQKKSVQDSWPMDTQMQPIGRIDEDPYLIKKYKSLKHFYKGIKALGHPFPPDLAKEFFAHHDCPFQAITSIRQNGFDPKRRFGQVHEYGEYFGVTANISHGYFQKGNTQQRFSQMIIAYLLQCAQITTKEIFFYAVDNPMDWEYAFNLPVLFVTYGQNAANQQRLFLIQ